MLTIANDPACTAAHLTLQRLRTEIGAFECMARDDNSDLLDAAYCLDAPSLLPSGHQVSSVTLTARAWINRSANK